MEPRFLIVATLAWACTVAACAGGQPVGAPSSPAAPVAPAPAAGPELTPEADAVLTALERAGDQIQALAAEVRYDRYSPLMDDRQVRIGRLYFENPGAGVKGEGGKGKRFAILFEQLFLGDQKREDRKSYVFDGEWLVEKLPSEKLVIRRQIVAPGEQFDPLRIGQGPLPIPIGQPKSEILARFTVELRPPTDGLNASADAGADEKALLADMRSAAGASPSTYQLRLAPKGDPREADFKEVRLWYTKGPEGVLVPRMARTVNPADEVSSVLLVNVQGQFVGAAENARARPAPGAFDTRTPEGWEHKTEEFRGHEAGAPREPADAGDR
jgi:hypothetical protein